jgi:uncharacterized membrane protein YfcA
MKKVFLVCAFLVIGLTQVLAQNLSDSIEIRISSGVRYYQNGNKLTQKQLLTIMKTDNFAYREMVSAKTNSDMAIILGATGGFLLGYQVGKLIAGVYPNNVWALVGGVLMIASIPIMIQSNKTAKNAVRYYNDGLKQSAIHKPDYRIGFSGNGLALSMHF